MPDPDAPGVGEAITLLLAGEVTLAVDALVDRPFFSFMVQQFCFVGDVGGDPAGLVAGEQLGRRTRNGLVQRTPDIR